MRTRSLILGALAAPAAALVHHQYNSVPDGPMRTKATATTTTIAPPPAPSYMKAFLRERLGYTDDQIAETASLLETIPPPAAVAALPERCARLARANMALTPERMARALEATDEDWHDLLMELARQQVAAQGPIAVPPPSQRVDGGDEF